MMFLSLLKPHILKGKKESKSSKQPAASQQYIYQYKIQYIIPNTFSNKESIAQEDSLHNQLKNFISYPLIVWGGGEGGGVINHYPSLWVELAKQIANVGCASPLSSPMIPWSTRHTPRTPMVHQSSAIFGVDPRGSEDLWAVNHLQANPSCICELSEIFVNSAPAATAPWPADQSKPQKTEVCKSRKLLELVNLRCFIMFHISLLWLPWKSDILRR